jgi:hypothetical protein
LTFDFHLLPQLEPNIPTRKEPSSQLLLAAFLQFCSFSILEVSTWIVDEWSSYHEGMCLLCIRLSAVSYSSSIQQYSRKQRMYPTSMRSQSVSQSRPLRVFLFSISGGRTRRHALSVLVREILHPLFAAGQKLTKDRTDCTSAPSYRIVGSLSSFRLSGIQS